MSYAPPPQAPKKNMYHSELVGMGDVLATISTQVTASKFQGKPPYVGLTINGMSRTLSLESDQCAAALENLAGRTVTLRASGDGRNGDAMIEVFDEAGQPLTADAPPPQAPAPRPAAPAQHGTIPPRAAAPAPRAAAPVQQQRPAPAPVQQQRAAVQQQPRILFSEAQMQSEQLYMQALGSAGRVAEAWSRVPGGQQMTPELFQACVSSFWIQWKDCGFAGQQPVHPIVASQEEVPPGVDPEVGF